MRGWAIAACGAILVGIAAWWTLRGEGEPPVAPPPPPAPAAEAPPVPAVPPPSVSTDPAPAETASVPMPVAANPNALAVTGRVVDGRRFPVEGAAVTLHREGEAVLRTESGAAGRFRFEGLPRPEKGKWVPAGLVARVADGRVGLGSAGLSVDSPAVVDTREVVVEEAFPFSVRVVQDGSPVAGARVHLTPNQAQGFAGGPMETVTGEDGVARFDPLPRGACSLLARTEQPWRVGRAEALLGPETALPVEVAIVPARTVEVLVVEKGTEKPVPGATFEVRLMRRSPGTIFIGSPGPLPPVAPTDAEGRTRIEGTCPPDWLDLADVRAPGWFPQGGRMGGSMAVKPGETRARIELLPARTVRFPVEDGEVPAPADGTEVRLEPIPGTGGPEPSGAARMEGRMLVLENATSGYFHAFAVAPDGSRARLFAGQEGPDQPAVSFHRPRTVEILAKRVDGSPAEGAAFVLRNQGNNPLGPMRKTDASGRVLFEGLYGGEKGWGLAEAYHVPDETMVYGGRPAGSVDLSAGDAKLEFVVPGKRAVLVRMTVDGKPGLPAQYGLTVNGTWCTAIEEDPAKGEARVEVPVEASAPAITVSLQAAPYLPAQVEVKPVPEADPIVLEAALERGGALLISVKPPPDGRYKLVLQQRAEPAGAWGMAFVPGSPMGVAPGPDGIARAEPLKAGTYRVLEPYSGIATDPVEVRPGADPARCSLDLSRQGWAKGRVAFPEGANSRDVRILVEGAGIEPAPTTGFSERQATRPMPDGTFQVRVPGDRPVTLRPWHPILVPAAQDGTAQVTEAREDIVLRLVAGNRATFRLDQAPVRGYSPEGVGVRVFLFRGEPAGPAVTEGQAVLEGDAYAFGGFATGTWTVWIDAHGYAPAVLKGVSLGEGSTDLGTVALSEGSRIRLRVLVKEGQAVPRVSLFAHREEAPSYYRGMNSNGESEAVLAGLGPGRFRINGGAIMGTPSATGRINEVREVDGTSEIALDLDLR